MAVPHYAYLKLKLPGPNSVITVSGNFQRSDNCDREFSTISEMFGTREQHAELSLSFNGTTFPEAKRLAPDNSFDKAGSTRTLQENPTNLDIVSASTPLAQESELANNCNQ